MRCSGLRHPNTKPQTSHVSRKQWPLAGSTLRGGSTSRSGRSIISGRAFRVETIFPLAGLQADWECPGICVAHGIAAMEVFGAMASTGELR